MIYHISFSSEALATLLRTLIWPVIVMDAHVYCQIVSIVELFPTVRLWTKYILSRKVVRHVSLHVLLLPKRLRAARVAALERFYDDWLSIGVFKTL